ncbi:zinc ribbon domain-containing protein [Nocardioides sp. KIGAM211]|uniref:Zinc ribbon domain-containing protein n=1 Tax=Nocardioides luti TaxID=2761101 RepID=A0A7X0RDT9_9ACTN|nr:zinc ribbon domain-containing protein [Nocardioides luti]MBB6626380.1 zinc ribbon domain-containing protein [Nocardioides luti]
MPTCARCGTQNPDGHRFCGGCGQPLVPASAAPSAPRATREGSPASAARSPYARPVPGAADPADDPVAETAPYRRSSLVPPAGPPVLPPAPSTAPYAAGPVDRVGSGPSGPGAGPAFDWQRLVRGNWRGAGLTALTAFGIAGVLSLVLAVLAKPVDFGVDNGLSLVATLLGATFGADLVLHLDQPERGKELYSAHLGVVSLTVALVALVAAVYVFRRVTARYPKPLDAVLDAARAGLLLGLGVMVCAIVFRADNDEMGRGWGAMLATRATGIEATWGASVAGALLLSALVLFATLALASLAVRPDGWPAPVERAREWLAAPLYGLATILLTLPVAGLIGLLLLIVTGSELSDNDPTDDDLSAAIALIVGLLASGGFWLLALGGGAGFGSSSHESGASFSASTDRSGVHRLAYYADDTPGLWAAPVVLVAVLLLAAYVVVRRSSAPARVLPNLAVWVATLLVVLPLLARVTSLQGGIDSDNAPGYHAGFRLGVTGWETTLLLTLVGLVCAVLVALLTGSVDRAGLRAGASGLAGRLQSDPSRPAGAAGAGGPGAGAPGAGRPGAGWAPAGAPQAPPAGWHPPGTEPLADPTPPAPVPGSPWPSTGPTPPTQPLPEAAPPPWPPADSGPDDGRTRIRPAQPPRD